MDARPLMTQAAYARSRGVSKQAIGKHVKSGLIPVFDGKIDPEIADMKIGAHLDPARSKAAAGIEAPRAPTVSGAEYPAAADGPREASYAESRATREKYDALKRKLEVEQLEGTLVDRESVEKALNEAGRMLRDSIMAVPVRLAANLAATTDPRVVQTSMEDELRRALENFAKLAKDKLRRRAN